ncbi:hypothetical protein LBMAG53_34120 [Planctomycetota bacterium]|nr:hypothetical protein LBMAG53_34120 [Planctomycetota bacterium]
MNITKLNPENVIVCESQFANTGYSKPLNYFHLALTRQISGELEFFVAMDDNNYLGHTRIIWNSKYKNFSDHGVPEISDLNVVPKYRNQGIGSALIKVCEMEAKNKGKNSIGIGVGLYPDYNNAQRLYSKLGYLLDGNGVHYNYNPVMYGETPKFDDNLNLFFIKRIAIQGDAPELANIATPSSQQSIPMAR